MIRSSLGGECLRSSAAYMTPHQPHCSACGTLADTAEYASGLCRSETRACPWPGHVRDRPVNIRREQRDKCGLALLQAECHRIVAVRVDLGEVLVPGGTGIGPQPVLRASG